MAGPLNGSVMGAARSASRFFAIARVFSVESLLIGQVGGGVGLEGLGAEEVHAIGGTRSRNDDEASDVAGSGHVRAFGGDEVVGLSGGLELDCVREDVGILREEAG